MAVWPNGGCDLSPGLPCGSLTPPQFSDGIADPTLCYSILAAVVMEASLEGLMTYYPYTHSDVDDRHHKRQRVGHIGQSLWVPNERLTTDLPPQCAYDPVRDSGQSDLNFIDSGFFDFHSDQPNEGSVWSPGPSTSIYHPPYSIEDNFLSENQSFYGPTTTSFAIDLDGFNESQQVSIPTPAETSSHSFAPSSEVAASSPEFVASPPEVPRVICFGMVVDIRAHCHQSGSLLVDSESLPLSFIKPNLLKHSDPGHEGDFGTLEDRIAKIFINLLTEDGIIIQIYSRNISSRPVPKAKGRKKTGPKASQSLINAIIYGPAELCERVGEYLTKCGIFLQDPVKSDQDVIYKNPQLLSRSEEAVFISELSIDSSDIQVTEFDASQDLFSQLSKDDHLSQTEAPNTIRTELYPHQKKALTFMQQREQAWTFEGLDNDLWIKEVNEAGGIIYTNLITNNSQGPIPPESRGGLLADKMGLGKSLTMISLIALNPAKYEEPIIFTSQGTIRRVKSTLVVVPYSLLKTWDTQLSRHLKPGTLSWVRFHGPQKRKTLSFSNYDIVITTYEMLVSQQKKQKNNQYSDTLFSFAWHRIVLDEAHTIRNRATLMAQACRAIRATSRWAMTGTPIQNRVTDFASLLEYLHIHPFSSPKTFDSEIWRPCLMPEDPDVSKLRKLVNCISLCRTKEVIDLPRRDDEIHFLDLSLKEREYYDRVKCSTIKKMDEALAHNPLAPSQYLNALQWLNELRLVCNHGLVHSRKVLDKVTTATIEGQPWNQKTAGKAFETLVKAGSAICHLCGENITEGTGEAANSEFPKPSLSKCLTLICGSCIQNGPAGQKVPTCSCTLKCPKVDVSWAPESTRTSPERSQLSMKPEEVSTKLKALLECIQQNSVTEKSVVFSYWTFTLDLIEILLKEASIAFTRIDGKQSGDQRDNAIQKLETDDSVRVILVSITCGGTGLDLTAASTAYILEPQWNPMIEEQALCRIHRLGQTKQVRTVRFRVKNSFEEKIASIQKSKKDLAAWAFSDGQSEAGAIDGTSRLQVLRGAFG